MLTPMPPPLPFLKRMRLKWVCFWFRMDWKSKALLVRLGLRKAPPRADPRSHIVNGIAWLFDPPSDKRKLH